MPVRPPTQLTQREARIAEQASFAVRPTPHVVVRATSADVVDVYGARQVPGAILSPPFHRLDVGTWTDPVADYSRTGDALSVDISTTGLGGIVDGIARSNTAEYLIWAVRNTNGVIEGAVATRVPQDIGVSVASGTMGTTATLSSFTSNDYLSLFTVGARVLLRVSSVAGSNWNQGTIATIGVSSMTVDLDAALAVTAETNTNLSGNHQLFQLDNFEPRVLATGVYGSNNFSLIARVVTDSAGNVLHARSIREWVPLSGVTVRNISHSATNLTQVCFGRWIPRWTSKVHLRLLTTVTSYTSGTGGTYGWRSQSGWQEDPRSDRMNVLSQQSQASSEINLRQRDCSANAVAVISGTSTMSVQTYLVEYAPEGRW